MSSTHSQVVVAFDFTLTARAAMYRALALAARAPFHVLHFVCAIDPHVPIPSVEATSGVDYAYAERVQRALTEAIELELRGANATGAIHFYVHARIGKPAEEILGVAREIGADLIIVGSKGLTGVGRLMLGSVSEKVVREAGCTVEVARPKTYKHVDLLQIIDASTHHPYVPPHRYSYEDHRVALRPADWPLY